MTHSLFLWIFSLSSSFSGQSDLDRAILAIAHKSPQKQIEAIQKDNIEVIVLDSERKLPGAFFAWGKIQKPNGKLNELTQIKNLMGRTLCAKEHPLASAEKMTIALASDAPRSTLLHEYLHVLQIRKLSSWCALSKELWKRKPSIEEEKLIRDQEWEVHQVLWNQLGRLNIEIEDRVTIAFETLEEAKKRKSFDPSASQWCEKNRVEKKLMRWITEYQKLISHKKSTH